MPRSFQDIIRLIQNGDPVDSSINRIFREQSGNIEFIKQLLDESLLGSATSAREVTVDSSVSVGQPVFYNAQTQRFEQAFAAAYADADTGEMTIAASSQVWGVCSYKHNSTKADILLHGYAELDVTNAISGSTPGLYYLSGTNAGKLVNQSPPVTVAVLFWDGESKVYVNPTFDNPFLGHQHYKFNLVATPAGTATTPIAGGHHDIIDIDTDTEGWLPANHEIFDGKAPAGAVFGYNLPASSLENLWPPLPASGAVITWTRPTTTTSPAGVAPGDIIYMETVNTSRSVAGNATLATTLTLTKSPALTDTDVVVTLDNTVFEAVGLEVVSAVLSSSNTISYSVRNPTDDEIVFSDDVLVTVYEPVDIAEGTAYSYEDRTVPAELVRIDHNGIWWMTDCYGLVPWAVPNDVSEIEPDESTPVIMIASRGVSRRDESDASNALSVLYGSDTYMANDVTTLNDSVTGVATIGSKKSVVLFHATEAQSIPTVVYQGAGDSNPFGICYAYDNKVIFTDEGLGTINLLDVSTLENTVLVSGLSNPKGVCVSYTDEEYTEGTIYFISDTSFIKRCDLDGGNVETVISGLTEPQFIKLVDNKLYWSDASDGEVRFANTDGSGETLLISGESIYGIDVSSDGTRLIYVNSDMEIKSVDITDGSDEITIDTLYQFIGSFDEHRAFGLHVASLKPSYGIDCSAVPSALTLWFSKMQFQTASTVVTSLRAAENSGLTVRCVHNGDETKTTGDLEIDLSNAFSVDSADSTSGHLVFKQLDDNTFYRGPVVDAIRVNSAHIAVSSTATSGANHRGVVTLTYTPTAVGSELPVESVRLSNVEEEHYQDTLALSFRAGIESEYRAKINVPAAIAATTLTIKLRFVVLARADGDLPTLELTARNIQRPGTTTATSLALPTTETTITLSSAAAADMVEDNYVELESAAITTTPGASVLFTLRRLSTDSYPGDVHIIDQRAVLNTVS